MDKYKRNGNSRGINMLLYQRAADQLLEVVNNEEGNNFLIF